MYTQLVGKHACLLNKGNCWLNVLYSNLFINYDQLFTHQQNIHLLNISIAFSLGSISTFG